MFIQQLYRYNKTLFAAFLLFIITFLYINYKWGVVAAPVFEYGMFSGPFHYSDTQTVYRVKAGNEFINSGSISFTQRDVMQIYPDRFLRQQSVNENAYGTMCKYFNALGCSSFFTTDKCTPVLNDTIFTNWYSAKIHLITGRPGEKVEVYRQHVVWNGKELLPVDSLIKIPGIVTY